MQNQSDELANISLLSASTGSLVLVKIANRKGVDWVLPNNLVLDKIDCVKRTNSLQWEGLDVPTFALLKKDETPEVALIIEGAGEVKRIALLVKDDIVEQKVRISELPDRQDNLESEQGVEEFCYTQVMYAGSPAVVPDLNLLASSLVGLK